MSQHMLNTTSLDPGSTKHPPGAQDLYKEAFHTQIYQTTTHAAAELASKKYPQGCSKETFHTQFPEQMRLLELKNPRHVLNKTSC